MKGVIHIFEIVIVALIMFVALFQFTYIPRMQADWTKTKLSITGWDILFTLDENGVNWLDPAEVESEVRSALNKTNIQFGVRIKGAPPNQIFVGCVCSTTEMNTLQSILSNLNLNGESITFNVTRIDPGSITFPHNNHVIFVWDYGLENYRTGLVNYLETGRGVVEMRDLDAGDIGAVQSDVFGLSWKDSQSPDSNNLTFDSVPADTEAYLISKYFYAVPNSSGQTYPRTHEFQNFLQSTEKVYQRDNDTGKIAIAQESTDVPACIVNHGIADGFGRTAWLSDPGSLEEDERVLIKSLVLWAAGKEFEVVKSDIAAEIAKFSYLKVLDTDMYQPIEIILVTGYLY